MYHYVERIVHHIELHKERLFDLHIQDALQKVFPQVPFNASTESLDFFQNEIKHNLVIEICLIIRKYNRYKNMEPIQRRITVLLCHVSP